MQLTTLQLSNYRGFEQLELELHPRITVLVGVNGAGKSSILDAIALSLTHVIEGVRVGPGTLGSSLDNDDLRVGAGHARVEVAGRFDGDPVRWSVTKTLAGYPEGPKSDVQALAGPVSAAQRSIEAGRPDLPLAVYFPTNRNALDIPSRIKTPHSFDALSAYDGALESGASNFRGFFEWFRTEEDLENEQMLRARGPRDLFTAATPPPLSRLSPVRHAVEQIFGATELRIERRPQRMTLLRAGRRLDVAWLSDGEKCLLALAGDLARRMTLVSPSEHPLTHPAVVLIDEVELHLHPGRQRQILGKLQATFPETQFIVSTHSPQVLSTVRAENVRLLDDFRVRPLNQGTWHRATQQILEGVFDDPGRPPEVARLLNDLRNAVDDDRFVDARACIQRIREQIEGDDPDVIFYEQLLPPEEPSS